MTLLQTVADTDAQEAADQKINALLAAQKDEIDGMIATGYIPSVVASKSLRTLGDKRIKFVGIDDDPVVLDAIKDGFVSGTMAQNPYGQGYIGAYVAGSARRWQLHRQGRRALDQDCRRRHTSSTSGTHGHQLEHRLQLQGST